MSLFKRNQRNRQNNHKSFLRRPSLLETLEHRRVLAAVPFTEKIVFNDGISRSQVVRTADLDGDSDPDAVALSAESILTFINDGSGNFGTPTRSLESLPGDARSLTLDDFDGDGDIDAVVGSIGSADLGHATVTMFANDGSGNFSIATTLLNASAEGFLGNFIDDIDSGDIDGDGAPDVVAVSRDLEDSRIYYFKNNGGTFADAAVITQDFIEPRAVHITDVDGDGNLDVVGTSSYDDSGTHNVFWYRNTDGAGTFELNATILDTGAEPRFMDSSDVDGDNDMDLVVPLQGAGEIILIENTDGNGTLAVAQTLASGLEGVERVAFGDVDGDGDQDIIANVDTAGQVIWLENMDGAGTYSDVKFVSEDTEQASGLSIVDLDADGDMDVMTTSQFASKVSTHINDGNGMFVTSEITPANAIEPQMAFLVDIDGDGDLDVLGQSEFDYEIAWYENLDGAGNFGGQNLIVDYDLAPQLDGAPRPTVFWDIETGDLDNDGDIDIITSEPNRADKIIWYENDGNGNFSDLHTFNALNDFGETLLPLELEVVDIDGDGDNDILANHYYYSGGVGWYENTDGQGTLAYNDFVVINNHSIGEHTLGDIDGDGDLDVLVDDAQYAALDNAAWFENLGLVDGQFMFDRVQVLKSEQASIDDVQLADMDGDGDLDAVLASFVDANSDSIIEWFENTDGAGTFANVGTTVGAQLIVSELYVVDIDNDGDQDILTPEFVGGSDSEHIVVFENDGNGTFSNKYNVNEVGFDFVALEMQIDIGDINGDGQLDVVAGKGAEDAFVWYMGGASDDSPFDLDMDGDVDGDDATLLCDTIRDGSEDLKFDLNGDGEVSNLDMVTMMRDGLNSSVGDSNFNGIFGTDDLVLVFTAAQYEDDIPGNSTWATGDWNCDGDFTTSDLVFAFTFGIYNGAAAVPISNGTIAAAVETVDQPVDNNDTNGDTVDPVVHVVGEDVAANLDAIRVDQVFNRDDVSQMLGQRSDELIGLDI